MMSLGNRILSIIILSIIIVSTLSCTKKEETNNTAHQQTDTLSTVSTSKPSKYEVIVPSNIQSQDEKISYLLKHYWDNFAFNDTITFRSSSMEEIMQEYISILSYSNLDDVKSSLEITLEKASDNKTSYQYFITQFSRFFHNPNSPIRNDEIYITVLENMIKSKLMNDIEKQKAHYDLNLVSKNRIGHQAADLQYTLASGKTKKLYQIDSPYTVLLFYNPDCESCKTTMNGIITSPIFNKCLDAKLISILAFYPDKDITIWKKYLPNIPNNWINGYDKNLIVEKKRTYDLPAIPTLYLLNKDKKVLLKDSDLETIATYLVNNNPLHFQ